MRGDRPTPGVCWTVFSGPQTFGGDSNGVVLGEDDAIPPGVASLLRLPYMLVLSFMVIGDIVAPGTPWAGAFSLVEDADAATGDRADFNDR